ncbi:MAG: type II secretion system protein, partial [bacterium]|nr:type II secretion system protein [bacterium]
KGRRRHKAGGFTLIEVVIAITIFAMVAGAVFYFYSNQVDNQIKLKEKYSLMRLTRQFIDTFTGDENNRNIENGSTEMEDYVFEWTLHAVEKPREVRMTSGLAPLAQLKLVHLQVFRKKNGGQVLSLDFLFNTIRSRNR